MAWFIYLVIICLVKNSEPARILAFFPFPSISHQIAFRPLTKELAKRGHEVVVVTTDPAYPKGKTPINMTEIDIHDVSYEIWREAILLTETTKGNTNDWINQAEVIYDVKNEIFEKQMMNDEVIKAVYKKKYDLIIVEACVVAVLGLVHVHDVPLIQASSFGALPYNLQTVGASIHIYRQPVATQQRVMPQSLFEKIQELYMFIKIKNILENSAKNSNKVIKKIFGPNVPDLNVLQNKVDMLFLNVHPLWDMNRAVPPNVIYMGGMHQNLPKELPQELKSYLDASKNGVIYISFGTNVEPSLLPADRIQTLVNTFSKLPYDILWKWSQDELPGRSPNIKISKWLPQSDLLRHPKIKLFITQGGLQSTDEAITAGVPLIGFPLLGDQWYNTALYVYYKIGMKLDLSTTTEESFLRAINTVLADESYRNNVLKFRSIIRDQSQSSLERAIWWTEYMLRHGGAKHLRSPLANITWAEYLEIELVLLIAVIVIIAILLMACLSFWIYKYISRLFHKKLKLKEK